MSSPDRKSLARCGFALALVASVALAGCNVRPLYGTAQDGGRLEGQLDRVDVAPTKGRVGQIVRNELLFLLNGGTPAASEYIVDLATETRFSDIIVRRIGGQPQGGTVTVQAAFRMVPVGEEVPIFSGQVTRQASFDRSNQRFANDRAELDAQERAAKEVAEEIRIRISAFFATSGALRPQGSPEIAPSLDDLTNIPGYENDDELDPFADNPGAADVPLPE